MKNIEETIYRVNGTALLQEAEPSKSFFLLCRNIDANMVAKEEWVEVIVPEIYVSDGPKNYQIHAIVEGHGKYDFQITKQAWRKWQDYKGDKKRLDVLTKVSSAVLKIKHVTAGKHIDIRVTPKVHDAFCKDAALCNKNVSDYCRGLMLGKHPKAALTPEQTEAMLEIVKFRSNLVNYSNALKAESAKIPKAERTKWIVEGMSYGEYRRLMKQALIYLDKLINSQK